MEIYRSKARIAIFFFILLISLFSRSNFNYNNIYVIKVIDGDTIRLINGQKVRLIGIDCPEFYESQKLYRDAKKTGESLATIQTSGRRAYEFTRDLVEGKRVRLEFDVEQKDKYARLLAYVFIDTGIKKGEPLDFKHHPDLYYDYFSDKWSLFVNAAIIKAGYANLNIEVPNVKYADLFRELYLKAKAIKIGLWTE